MKKKVLDTIKSHLNKNKTDKFLRKPILVCTQNPSQATDLFAHLRDALLKDDDVRNIICLSNFTEYEDAILDNKIGKQTVYVTSDTLLDSASINLSHTVIPLVINYGMG